MILLLLITVDFVTVDFVTIVNTILDTAYNIIRVIAVGKSMDSLVFTSSASLGFVLGKEIVAADWVGCLLREHLKLDTQYNCYYFQERSTRAKNLVSIITKDSFVFEDGFVD